MVDTISNAKGVRPMGASPYGTSSATSPSSRRVAPVSPSDGNEHHEQGGGEQDGHREATQDNPDLRIEVVEDEGGKGVVYRFIDTNTGYIVREWDADTFAEFRDYVREKHIHLLDKKV